MSDRFVDRAKTAGSAEPTGLARPGPHAHNETRERNALLAAANPLLDLLAPIRTRADLTPQRVRDYLIEQLRAFQTRAQHAAIPVETIVAARYCLCTALDEAAALAPWGSGGAWSTRSLLVAFHKETWGGEKFFQLLARVSTNPREHRDLLELQYFCLLLGFQGRYRVIDNGAAHRDTLIRRLHKLLHESVGGYPRPLSPAWRAADREPTRRMRRALPLWVWLLIGGIGGAASFGAFRLAIDAHAERVSADIEALPLPRLDIQSVARAAPLNAASDALLRRLLDIDLRNGTLTLRDEADRSVIAVRGDSVFDSGSAAVNPAYVPLLVRLADALNRFGGDIVITGHTDDQPIRDRRFASNLALSQARAAAVKLGLLTGGLDAGRSVAVAGRGDVQPVATNRTVDGRARNRRVEIAVFPSPASRPGMEEATGQ